MPEFLIVTPMYNAAVTVAETIASVRRQTVGDWQMIVMDDGSSDDSIEVALNAAHLEPRIQVVANGRVQHIGTLRNRALRMSTASWVSFLDADDVWQPNFLEAQRRLLVDANAKVVHSAAKHLINGTIVNVPPKYRGPRVCPPPAMVRYLCPRNPIYSPSVVLCYEVMMSEGGFSEHADHFSVLDTDLWLRLAPKYCFAYNPEPLVYYRVSGQSLSGNPKNFLRNYRGEIIALEAALNSSSALSPDLIKLLRRRLGRSQAQYARLLLDEDPPNLGLARFELRKALRNGFYGPRFLPFELLAISSQSLPYRLHRVYRWLRDLVPR